MLKTFTKGGVHPHEHKLTAGKKIEQLPLPEIVHIPLAQHLGVPAKVLVKKGDKVKTGQLIGQTEGFVSANVHASVSGTVSKVDLFMDASGYRKMAVSIQVEGDEWVETIDRSESLVPMAEISSEDILKKVAEAGIVGLGGATFPTHVKMTVPVGKKAEVVIINGVECEPYLTSDHSLMMEKGPEIIVGVKLLMKALKVENAWIGIEANKPDAIEHLTRCAAVDPRIKVQGLKVKYPQGGEKQLIKAVLNREVPSGGLPIDVGAVVFNVGSTFAVYEAVQKNKPLFERIITVTGHDLKTPANFRVRIGTLVSKLVEAAGGIPGSAGKVISGGPMMGKALATPEVPVTKGSSGILVLPEEVTRRKPVEPCIRCAKCVSVCPMGLEPYLLMPLSERTQFERMEKERVMDCIECGSCSFICPANRPLLDHIRYGKANVNKLIRSRKK
ncbi:MAG: electron transport complex subunit RsxC [Bacteroidales bacterium]